MRKSIEETMKELAEYTSLKEEMEMQIESLKDEIKNYMTENGVDEVLSEDGSKATWREVISNRFDSTAFKKDFLDIYKEYTKKTTSKRFTFNV
jgi:predicted phage-related endonuclease